MMTVLSIAFLIFIMIISAILRSKKDKHHRDVTYQYYKVKEFMDDSEKDLYHTLIALYSDRYIILSKVRVWDVLQVKQGLSSADRRTLQNYIRSKHTDFLLCERTTTKPVVAIELDGSSHSTQSRRSRDKLMNDIYSSADMAYVHIPIEKRDDRAYIAAALKLDPSLTKSYS